MVAKSNKSIIITFVGWEKCTHSLHFYDVWKQFITSDIIVNNDIKIVTKIMTYEELLLEGEKYPSFPQLIINVDNDVYSNNKARSISDLNSLVKGIINNGSMTTRS